MSQTALTRGTNVYSKKTSRAAHFSYNSVLSISSKHHHTIVHCTSHQVNLKRFPHNLPESLDKNPILLMKKLFKKVGFNAKKATLKKNGDSHSKINEQHVPDEDGSSPMLHDDSDTKSNHLNREKLSNVMKGLSQAVESTHGITGRHDNNQLVDYDGQLGISVVERLSVFTNTVQKIADAHPYSKIAWMIISSVVTVVTYTQGIDQDMQDLFETLDSTYKFIEDTKEIENVPAYERILTDIAKQTVDCAYFIRAYAKNTNFWIRAGKNLIGRPIKPRVETYKDAFAKILAQFQIHSALHTEIAVGRLLECNQSLKVSLDLDSLPYAGGAGLQIGKQCLVGTRTEVLDEIVDWVNDPDDSCPRLFWLAGPAGVGKSAIAHSIASRFDSIGRLGSFFCFDKNDSTKRREKVFSTIARDLADLDTQIKHQLAEVIQNKTSLRNTTDLQLQWKNFIFRPLHDTSKFSTGPILVVIDALDESGDPISRQELLNILAGGIPSLPSNVRFLVTSRPERDITSALEKPSHSHVRSKLMDTIPEAETNRDILTYFKVKLIEHGSCAFEDAQLSQLVTLSQGLFQWAYLASQFLNGLGNTAGLTIAERYKDLTNVQRICFINDPLDAMYTQILSSLFNPNDPRVMTRFHSIIGSILVASEPLSLNNLVVLRGDDIPPSRRETDIKEIIQHMGALLSGISDSSSTIRPLHLSFREYLLDKKRSHDYSVNLAPCHQGLAYGCLRTMMEGLKFNICSISTSHRCNADDENLPERISSSIPIPLSYSCRFWATHVISAAFDRLLATKTEKFLSHGFLLWLEVLSLLKAVNIAVRSMPGLMAWSSREESHKALYNFVADGTRFVRLFIDVIAMSAPHIYISALPFCPQDSIIYKTFIGHFPNTLRIASKAITTWPLVQQRRFMKKATCICFSHGGEYLAVGLQMIRGFEEPSDITFQLLDAETLGVLWTMELPEDQHIRAIQFYTSDKSLVFATDLEVYQFNILTGSLTELHHISQLSQTCFEKFSPNAKFVTYVREDCLTTWNLQSQECVVEISWQKSLHSSYSFLTNNSDILVTYLASVGAQVWDLQTGAILPGLSRPDIPISILPTSSLKPHVSPNGIHIIFLQSHQLHLWNFRDNSVIDLGHGMGRILAISPNGDYYAATGAGSTDVILYNLKGNSISYGAFNDISCTAFSKDGRRFAIHDRDDGYLKIREVDRWQNPAGFDHGCNLSVNLRFMKASPAGNYHLFSKLKENSYEIWDVELNQLTWKLSMATRMVLPTFSSMDRYFSWIFEGTAKLHDINSKTAKEFHSGDQKATIRSLAFSRDETLIATLAVNVIQKKLHICTWDIDSSEIVNTLIIADVMSDLSQYPTFKASSNFRYFAYSLSNDLFLYSHTSQPIPLDFLHSSSHDNSASSSDEKESSSLDAQESSSDDDVASSVDEQEKSGHDDVTFSLDEKELSSQDNVAPSLYKKESSSHNDFAFSLDEKHILVTKGLTVFHMDLTTNEHHAITMDPHYFASDAPYQISPTSSGVLLIQILAHRLIYAGQISIFDAFTGQCRSSNYMSYPSLSVPFADFLNDHQLLVTAPQDKDGSASVWKLNVEEDDWIRFSSDENHSLKSLPRGSSTILEEDGWVTTENIGLLFWVPSEYHQTLHVPQLKYLVGGESTKLDLSSFAHGESWTDCYKPVMHR